MALIELYRYGTDTRPVVPRLIELGRHPDADIKNAARVTLHVLHVGAYWDLLEEDAEE